MLINILIILSLTIPLINSPPLIGFVLFCAAFITIWTLIIFNSTWIALIIIIIYVGGLIVIFSYFTSISPNEPLATSPINILLLTAILIATTILLPTPHPGSIQELAFANLINTTHLIVITLLAYILFLTLIIVVTITNPIGSLRPFASKGLQPSKLILSYSSLEMPSPRNIIPSLTNTSIDLPTPINISFIWNFGSLLGLILTLQITTGLLLTIHYSPHIDTAFLSIAHITRDVSWGWILRNFHANGASIFFILIYIHILRALIYISFNNHNPWSVGVTIYILTIATAFIGYLLPWGQMSFWGATVITNLFSALPYVGNPIVLWIWGGYAVSGPTLTRFFTLHFLLPFILAVLSVIHLIYLHETGSSSPLGSHSNIINTSFHIHFSSNDTLGFLIILLSLSWIAFFSPNIFNDPENFIPANPLVTPTHINPEWYFLWAYAILRSIPNNLGGVICIFAAILLLYTLPISRNIQTPTPIIPLSYLIIIISVSVFIILTWIGSNPVEDPYITIGIVTTIIYFTLPLISLTLN